MRTCPQCGYENPPGGEYCSRCGSSLAGSSDFDTEMININQPVYGNYCRKCGARNPDESLVCQSCGEHLGLDVKGGGITPSHFRDVSLRLRKLLEGHYEVLEELGRGGMSIVYKARDVLLDRPAAIKVLPIELSGDRKVVERFLREAKTAARLHHPNVVAVYSVRQMEELNFIIMQYIEGKTVNELIRESGELSLPDFFSITKEVCRALNAAHKLGIIHRDIKPDNIIVRPNGSAAVTDFGIARAVGRKRLVKAESMEGTAYYMSPEQVRGMADIRGDLYSLGVVAYKMLTGTVPFQGTALQEIGDKHLEEIPRIPRSINRDIPESVEDFILKALRKDAGDRYQSASEMLDALIAVEKAHTVRTAEPVEVSEESEETRYQVERLMEAACGALSEDRLEEGILLLQKILFLQPEHENAGLLIDDAESRIKERRFFRQMFDQADKKVKDQEYEVALKFIERILEMDPKHATALRRRAEIKEMIGQEGVREVSEHTPVESVEAVDKPDRSVDQKERTYVCADLNTGPKEAVLEKTVIDDFEEDFGEQTVMAQHKKGEEPGSESRFRSLGEYEDTAGTGTSFLTGKLNRRHLAIILIVLGIAATGLAYYIHNVFQVREEAQRLLDEGILAFNAGRYEESAGLMDQVLELQPQWQEAERYKQQAVLRRQAVEKQREIQEKIDSLLKQAKTYFQQSEYDRAKNVFNLILKEDPYNEEAKRYINLIDFESDKIEKEKEAVVLAEAASGFISRNRFKEAENTIQKIEVLDADHPEIAGLKRQLRNKRYRVWEEGQKKNRIDELWKQAQKDYQNKEYQAVISGLNELLEQDGSNQEAKELLTTVQNILQQQQKAIEKESRVDRLMSEAESYMQQEDAERAITALNNILELEPGHSEALSLLDTAKELQEEQLHEEKINSMLSEVNALFADKNYEEAMEKIEEAYKQYPHSRKVRALRASIKKALTSIDRTPPVVTIDVSNKISLADDVTLEADITDESAVRRVTLFYKMKGAGDFKQTGMAYVIDSRYSAAISRKELKRGKLQFYIEAEDGGGNIAKSPLQSIELKEPSRFVPQAF